MAMQRTPLYDVATGAGATSQEWHGWELPMSYGDVEREYRAALEGVALHDSSYTGRIKALGEDVLDLLHRISTNDVGSLQPGQGAPTVLTTDRGRILDLITALNLGDYILLLTSPQARDEVVRWIDKYTIIEDITLEDVTNETAMLSVMGPEAPALLGSLAGVDLGSFQPDQSAPVTIAGADCHIIRRDLVSLPRFDIVLQGENAGKVWQEITAAGAAPVGMEAYQALRIGEVAPEYGGEMGEAYNPLETGLWGSISFTKGCYIGQEVIARLDTYQKVQKHLVSLSFSPNARVQEGAKLAQEGKEVGAVTSVVKKPTTGELMGLGYVRKGASEVGTQLSITEAEDAWAKVEAQALPLGPGEQT
jgi:folate-binding protein YgfZ